VIWGDNNSLIIIVYDYNITRMTIQIAHSKTTSELIAELIRNAIINGEYRSGEPLKQDVLARHYEVSKIPIREALYQLKMEGLVTFLNNRGVIVSSLSISEVEEIYSLRIVLEEMALQRAIPNLQVANKVAAESALKLIDGSTNPLDWTALNWEFHASLYKAANTPKLLEIVATLHNNVSRYLLLYLRQMDFQETSQAEHWALLDACNAGKTQQALGILRQHLNDALEQTLHFMKQRN
jgi:DNA-binding GntR family transcriptional regulator